MHLGNSFARLGFTIIELMVVLVIISTLMLIVYPKFNKGIDRATEIALNSDLVSLRIAIDRFYSDKGHYPSSLQDLVTEKYIRKVPIDPITQKADWKVVYITDDNQQVVYDIKSNAQGLAKDGTAYNSW